MSLLPISPVTMSKLKYHILKRLDGKEEKASVLDLLGPYPVFHLVANFRKLTSSDEKTLEGKELSDILNIQEVEWDCCETVYNMHKRTKDMLKEYFKDSGVLRVVVQYRYNEALQWNDCLVDEFPLNITYDSLKKGD